MHRYLGGPMGPAQCEMHHNQPYQTSRGNLAHCLLVGLKTGAKAQGGYVHAAVRAWAGAHVRRVCAAQQRVIHRRTKHPPKLCSFAEIGLTY